MAHTIDLNELGVDIVRTYFSEYNSGSCKKWKLYVKNFRYQLLEVRWQIKENVKSQIYAYVFHGDEPL
jgi:hypothetical protein